MSHVGNSVKAACVAKPDDYYTDIISPRCLKLNIFLKSKMPGKMSLKTFSFHRFFKRCHLQCAIEENFNVTRNLLSKSSGLQSKHPAYPPPPTRMCSVHRVGMHQAKSNSCSIGFTKLICTVASEYYRFGPFDKKILKLKPVAFEIYRLPIGFQTYWI
jgi:hypothetical protein